jgi:hypothetical protein
VPYFLFIGVFCFLKKEEDGLFWGDCFFEAGGPLEAGGFLEAGGCFFEAGALWRPGAFWKPAAVSWWMVAAPQNPPAPCMSLHIHSLPCIYSWTHREGLTYGNYMQHYTLSCIHISIYPPVHHKFFGDMN